MYNEILDNLVTSGVIKSYSLVGLDENGDPGESYFRNSEKLSLVFSNGQILVLDTYCSGVLENSGFCITEESK